MVLLDGTMIKKISKNIKKFFTKTIAKFAKKMHNISVIGDIASAIKFRSLTSGLNDY